MFLFKYLLIILLNTLLITLLLVLQNVLLSVLLVGFEGHLTGHARISKQLKIVGKVSI